MDEQKRNIQREKKDEQKGKVEQKFVVIAHNIRSAHNIGSIFRTADGCGVDTVFLTGYTPEPATGRTVYLQRSHKDLAKTALGAEKNVSWKKVDDFHELLKELRSDGFYVMALEQSPKSVDYRVSLPFQDIALVLGNEVVGVEDEMLEIVDGIIEIPMRGKKNSLNVSVAFGIAAFEIRSKMERG